MKRNRKKKSKTARLIRLWTYPQAEKALPYLRSITSSLREHWLEARSRGQKATRLASQPGRHDRGRILANEEANHERAQAEDRFNEALSELMGIDVYLLDPVRGVAFIPFQKGENLAWFVFELFEDDNLRTWRFHEDPLDTRRPISEVVSETRIEPLNN